MNSNEIMCIRLSSYKTEAERYNKLILEEINNHDKNYWSEVLCCLDHLILLYEAMPEEKKKIAKEVFDIEKITKDELIELGKKSGLSFDIR